MLLSVKNKEKGGSKVDKNLKLVLGKAFGELYEIQKQHGINKVDNGHIYGLLHGFEEALDKEFENLSLISREETATVLRYFEPFLKVEKETSDLPSYDEMREEMKSKGITPERFITILRYLNACDRINVDVNQDGHFKLTDENEKK